MSTRKSNRRNVGKVTSLNTPSESNKINDLETDYNPEPFKIRIGNLDFPMYEKEQIVFNGSIVEGLYERDLQKITIKSSLPPQQKAHVALHEVIHAITDMYGVDLNERDTDLMALGLSLFLRDNSIYIEALIQDLVDHMD